MAKTGKANPLNPFPDLERGNVLVIATNIEADLYGANVGEAVALGPMDVAYERARGASLYLSHFATCEQRASFRRR